MAKYSTGSGGGGDAGDACELCGKESGKLRRANVAGANLLVCGSCAPHGDQPGSGGRSGGSGGSGSGDSDDGFEGNRKKRAAQRAAKLYDKQKGDPAHWEKEGTNYEKDRLPYLVSGYGGLVETARQEEGLQVEELASELEVEESALLAVEQGRAARAGVGGSLIRALEERLDVRLVDE